MTAIPLAGAWAKDYLLRHPSRACDRCRGRGVAEESDAGTCTMCRGLGQLPMTIDQIRDAYREIRERVCGSGRMTREVFDRRCTMMATERQPLPTAAGMWLWAAREISDRIETDRKAARGRW